MSTPNPQRQRTRDGHEFKRHGKDADHPDGGGDHVAIAKAHRTPRTLPQEPVDLESSRRPRRLAEPFFPVSSAGKIGFPGAILPNRRRTLLSALFICCTFAHAQTITFEFQTPLDSPIKFVNFTPGTFRTQSDRRQLLTVKNESDKATAAVVFQQAIAIGSKTEIITIERVSIIIRPREKKRLSVSVRDVWNQLQTAVKSGETIGKPVLSVAAVEFIDGSSWSASLDREHE